MPWETKFDITTAVNNAAGVFWAKGYKSTSLNDLLGAMEINKGSFYNTFGSKKNLFHKALLHYEQTHRVPIFQSVEEIDNPIDSISNIFDLFISSSTEDLNKKGCFIVNTALELTSHGKEINGIVQHAFNEVTNYFERQLKKGISMGVIAEPLDTEQTAQGLMALLISIRVMSRGALDKKGLEAIKSQAMRLF